MKITTYYYGGTGVLSGFTFDTVRKTYKEFSAKIPENYDENKFKLPGDLDFFNERLRDAREKLDKLIKLGFEEDKEMPLDFGIFTL